MPETAKYYYAKGRRKEAVATARLFSGKGTTMVNDVTVMEYFNNKTLVAALDQPLKETGNETKLYATIKVSGGGKHGQAEAARLAIARALLELNADLRPTLKKAGLLTRDPREKERKKPGLKRARKASQFSKR
ncbi:MAG TPA: 30S ribosomal protein S9 [Candidatus Saccharimonadales bacterium]|nr:30S ribosomal protein S9 [Candidatus Saccharimonadales bacterium]